MELTFDIIQDEMIHDWNKIDFDQFIFAGINMSDNSFKFRVGKVVQVRKEAGDFGSDMVLIRTLDGKLARHENQYFCTIKDEFIPELEKLYIEQYGDERDEPNTEYTLGKEFPETGFIIPSKVKEGETTPMRDIKNKLYSQIEKYCS